MTTMPSSRRRRRSLGVRWPFLILLGAAFLVQAASGLFFAASLVSDLLLIRLPLIPWQIYELLQILASFGLIAGMLCSVFLLAVVARRNRRIDDQIAAASGAFQHHVDRQFALWELTPAERYVALLIIKGFSNSEIAGLRHSTESTVKSHVTAIFRKSGLTSRQQLVSCVIEDLLAALSDDREAALAAGPPAAAEAEVAGSKRSAAPDLVDGRAPQPGE